MENDNNHINEKAAYVQAVDGVVKKNEQWSENGSEGYPYEDESGGSNPEISTHYEEIHTDQVQSYVGQFHDIQAPIFFEKCTDFRNPIKASSQHDVGNLMPVTSVYSVTPDTVAQHHDYTHSMHAASPIVTTMVSAVPIEHTETPQHTVVQFEPEGAYAPQVKVICNPEQQINDLGHHREVQQQTQPREVDQNQHENVHEKNQETEEMNSTPTAHPDMNSLQQLAATQDPLVQNGIRVELQGKQLWRTFYEIGTEMIITKVGRRMFPAIRIKISGLKPQKKYAMLLDIEAVDDNRYRYVYHSSKWMVAGTADNPVPPRVYVHPESPATGENWMRQVVSFDKLKLTNHENDTQGHMILHSMHKYQPRVHVIEVLDEANPPVYAPNQRVDLTQPGITTFIFRETQFITVTAYQNQQITRLKIDRNPFAKGFRNSGRNKPTHYDSNGPPVPGTYAAWRSSNLAAAANSNSKSSIQEFEHQATPVTGWSNPIHHHPSFQAHSTLQPKYTGQPAYPSINNLSPSSLNSSNLAYSTEARDHVLAQPYAYNPYSVPCNLNNRQDSKVEVAVLANPMNSLHLPNQRQNHKRAATTHDDPYAKEPRYDEDYVSPESPNHIQTEIHPHHLHHYNHYN